MGRPPDKLRVKEFRKVKASDLVDHPQNWRTHPKAQKAALKAVMDKVGFAGAVLTRKLKNGKLQIIDGHLRKELAGNSEIPVLVTNLTEEEARLVLATYDPIGSMADRNDEILKDLIKDIDFPGLDNLLDIKELTAPIEFEEVEIGEKNEFILISCKSLKAAEVLGLLESIEEIHIESSVER